MTNKFPRRYYSTDQTEIGLKKLAEELGIVIKRGWKGELFDKLSKHSVILVDTNAQKLIDLYGSMDKPINR